VLVERSEPALYTVDRELCEAWPELSIVPVVGDVGDRVFTGVRPGEKLFEELQYSGESIDKTRHPKIAIGRSRGCPVILTSFVQAGRGRIRRGAGRRRIPRDLSLWKPLRLRALQLWREDRLWSGEQCQDDN
jgi:FlaA1/EpsC-like NDP-sugar epimerase